MKIVKIYEYYINNSKKLIFLKILNTFFRIFKIGINKLSEFKIICKNIKNFQ